MRTLSYGNIGAEVRAIQLALFRAGFLWSQSEIDGIFGSNTQNAVYRFQRAYGLVPDGIVGTATWRVLTDFLRGYRLHRVVAGDTFYRIARKYGTTAAAIAIANPDVNPYTLTVGSTLTVPLPFDVVSSAIPINSTLCAIYSDGITARYPFVKSAQFGSSVLGKPLKRLRIGDSPNIISYNASHHANEWITTLVVLKFIEQLASAYAYGNNIGGFAAQELLDNVTLDVIPLVNPDGVDLVTGLYAKGSPVYERAVLIAADYPDIPFPDGWKANIDGVDLNLNYPASWDTARDIKFAQGYTTPAPRDFVGPYPLSEPETRAMVNISNRNFYNLSLSYHTQGRVIYWKYDDFEPADSYVIGQKLAAASNYALELTPSESANAGYKDWFILTFDKPAYTVEAGLGVNPLPLEQFDEIYSDNVRLMAEAMRLSNILLPLYK